MSLYGNTFGKQTVGHKHARKVWREVRQQYPAGGTITNITDFASTKVIPAGSFVKYDMSAKTIEVITEAKITACISSGNVDAAKVAALGVNGYLYNDAYLLDGVTVATGTVVYEGELYKYMLSENAQKVAAQVQLTTVPQVVLVM